MNALKQKKQHAAATHKSTSSFLPILVCSLAALLYVYEFMARVVPSAMTTDLMRAFHIQSVGLGFLSALFFYGYTPMQIPAGLIYDRFSPRLLLSLATLICALTTLCFALTHQFIFACIARLAMGMVAAFAFVGALLIASRWFSAKRFAFYTGVVQFLGCMGAIAGQTPISMLKNTIGWRETNYVIAAIGTVFAVLMWVIIRDYPANYKHSKKNHQSHTTLSRLKQVYHNSQTWWIGVYGFSSWAPITIFATLWGIPYLSARFLITDTHASAMIIAVWVGIAIGSPFIGWWSNFLTKRRLPMLVCSIIGLMASIGIIYLPNINITTMLVLLFLLGFSASGQVISFALTMDNSSPGILGTAIGFNNMAVIAGGVLLQPLVGILLKLTWHGKMHLGIPLYSITDYHIALAIIPACYLLGITVASYCVKETHCQSS